MNLGVWKGLGQVRSPDVGDIFVAKIELTVGSSRSCTRWILHQSLSRARSKRSNGRLCPAMPISGM